MADTCRICLNKGLWTNIFSVRNSVMISKKIMSVAKIQVDPDDGLPSTICTVCIDKLDECIGFVKQCEISDMKLRNALLEQGNICKQSHIHETNTESVIARHIESDDVILNDKESSLSSKKESATNCNTNTKVHGEQHFLDEFDTIQVKLEPIDDDSPVEFNSENDNKKKTHKVQCFTCGKVMSSRFRLKTHLRTHTGERPYSCTHCHKKFSLAQNLKVHLRIHTGERPLQCNVCGAKFAQSAGLTTHKRKHTGQTPYRCTLCPRSFRTAGHLQYHIRYIHTPAELAEHKIKRHTGEKNFECDTCSHAFITRSDLNQHLLIHSGYKPHVCCVCGNRFTRSSHLRRHMKHTHNGKKLFECNHCSMDFDHKNDYEKHMKKHNTNNSVQI